MHKTVVQIRDISEAKLYMFIQFARHDLPLPKRICPTLYHTIIPYHAITGCDAVSDIAGYGHGSAWSAFCSNPDLLANLGKDDFHDET